MIKKEITDEDILYAAENVMNGENIVVINNNEILLKPRLYLT